MDLLRWLRAEWDRVAGYGLLAAGGALLVAGLIGVRNATDVVDQVSYLVSGGIGSIFLLGVGSTLLLSADLHDDWRKLHRVERHLASVDEKLDRVGRLLAGNPSAVEALGQREDGTSGLLGASRPVDVSEERADQPNRHVTVLSNARRLQFGALALAGAVFLLGWLRTSFEPDATQLTLGVNLALAGAFLAALGAAVVTARLRGQLAERKVAVLGHWVVVDHPTAAGPRPEA